MSSDWSTEGPDCGSRSEAPSIRSDVSDTVGHGGTGTSSGYNMAEHSDIIEKAEWLESEGAAGFGEGGLSEQILHVVEDHIIPRLVRGSQEDPVLTNTGRDAARMPSEGDVIAFADLAVNTDVKSSLKFIESLIDKDISIESIYLDLISPAAKYLGDMWVEDRVDFSRVSLGASCMQRSLIGLGQRYESKHDFTAQRSMLITAMPGDQHMLGPSIAAEFLRRYGWHAKFIMPNSPDDITNELRQSKFDILGLSLSCDDYLADLEPLITHVRSSAGGVGILAGGRAVTADPGFVRSAGSDVVALDARDAVVQAKQLLETRQSN